MKKLHLGCGYTHKKGYINVDIDPANKPDIVMNLEQRWTPFIDNSVDHVECNFVLEHLTCYKHFFTELYRVLKPGGTAKISVPCSMDFTAFQDPTHVKYYMPNTIIHICNTKHEHYNTNTWPWNFGHTRTKLLHRNWHDWCLFWFFRLLRLDNVAYLFVWGSEWYIEKQ